MKHDKTLGERLSEAKAAPEDAQLIEMPEDVQSIGAPEDVQPIDAPEDVRRALGASPTPDARSDEPDTDAIVAAAKAMRDRYDGQLAPQAAAKVCLIVDDSRVIRKVSAKIAKSLGYVPLEAQDGEEALARCKQAMPALVLTDWNMPEMDGIEFVRRLRSIPTPQEPIVVFCTSNGEAKDIHEGIGAGADDYIVKPFDEAALRAKLERLGRS